MNITLSKKERLKRTITIFIIVSMLLMLWGNISSIAYAVKAGDTGTVNSDVGLYLRSGPGMEYGKVALLDYGESVEIISTAKDTDGDVWYKVKVPAIGKEGYCYSEYIDIDIEADEPSYEYSEDFEENLVKQGFPETYKPYLRDLHAQYPKWIFKAQHTGLDWKYVIDKESKLGVSLVESDCLDSWKSTDYGAFNPATGEYTIYDSGGWVAASRPIVEHYVDPRNYLTESRVFAFLGNKYDSSTQTKAGVDSIVDGSFMAKSKGFPESGYATYSDVLMAAGKKSGVSPYVLASMIIIEQGTRGASDSISGKVPGYEGIYNYFNVGAYSTSTMSAIERGLWYASGSGDYGRPWNSRVKSINGGAQVYAENYVKANKFTLYLKRFNVLNGADAVGTMQYMTSIYGAAVEGMRLSNAWENLKDNPVEFYIPVYKNMPDNACPKPTSSGDNNYHLKSLSVSGYSLTPAFGTYKTSYELVVDANVSSVKISATPYSSKAKVSGTGTISLKEKDTTVSVKVTAASGYTKTYKILISKVGEPDAPPEEENPGTPVTPVTPTPSISSNKYSFGTYVTGVTEKTTVEQFKKNVTVKDGSIKIYDAKDNVVTSGNVGTAMKVKLFDVKGKKVSEYIVCVKGDVNGDGVINAIDSLLVKKHIVGLKSLVGAYLKAADVNCDERVNTIDSLKVEKHIVGLTTIN